MRTVRIQVAAPALVALALTAMACSGSTEGRDPAAKQPTRSLTVGAAAPAESQIVAQMYIRILEDNDYDVENALGYGSAEDLRAALEEGEIDVAPLHLASLASGLQLDVGTTGDPNEVAQRMRPMLNEGLRLLDPALVNSGNGVVLTRDTAERLGVQTISELAGGAGKLTVAATAECAPDPGCLPALEGAYGIRFGSVETVQDPAASLDDGDVDVAVLPATSGLIRENRWFVLQDDLLAFPAENVTPVVRHDVMHAETTRLLNAVSASLNLGHLTLYNRVFELGQSPGSLATLHLSNARLLGGGVDATPAVMPDQPPEGCEDARGQATVSVVAEESVFSTGCLIVSGDQTIEFINRDRATPHTFTVSRDTSFRAPFLLDLDDALGDQTLTSEPIGQTVEEGGWPFVCRYHAYMAGQIWVR